MKRILSLLLCLAMLLSLTACAQQKAPAAAATTTTEAAAAPVSRYPLTLTDQAGREVTIAAQPQKLISSYYITTSAIMALGLTDKLVGIEQKPEKRPIYGLSAPQLLEKPSIGTAKELDLEAVAALAPDLLILPMKLKGTVETLENLGMTVLLVNPESQQLLEEMICLIADATNTGAEAGKLLGFLKAQQESLTSTLSGAPTPTVYLAGNSNLLSTAGNAMYQADLIRLAGGRNAAEEIDDTYWAEISYEQLLTWDPEYIILASDAKYTVADVLADPNLAACRAVTQGKVYQLPSDAECWDSPVPSGILGAVWLANILHPDQVPNPNDRINEYYETFYHFSYPISQ